MLALLRRLGHCRALPSGLRDRVLRALAPPGSSDMAFEAPFFGCRYPGNLSVFLDWTVYFYGAYEAPLLGFLRDVATPGTVFADIGANIGHHTLFMAPRVAAVHAFEPWGRVRARIAEKVALNKLHNVTIHATGLGREDAVLPFVTPLDENTGQGTFRTDTGVEASETLPIARGDGWFAAHDIRPNLMKIDVEGLEPDVLAGLAETIRACRPIIVTEWSAWSRAGGKPLESLPPDYRAFGLTNQGDRPYRLIPAGEDRHYEIVLAPEEADIPMHGPAALQGIGA